MGKQQGACCSPHAALVSSPCNVAALLCTNTPYSCPAAVPAMCLRFVLRLLLLSPVCASALSAPAAAAAVQCFRGHGRRNGERRRKSVRGCIVSPDLSVLNLVSVKCDAAAWGFGGCDLVCDAAEVPSV